MTNDNNPSQQILSALEETLRRILRIGYYEMSGQKEIGQVHEFAELLPAMCEQYEFATKEELAKAQFLLADLIISDEDNPNDSCI